MSETAKRLTWRARRNGQASTGRAGSVPLFRYTWDSSKNDPGEPYVMTTDLPGYVGARWRASEPGSLEQQAEEVFAAWLKAAGVVTEVPS